MDLTYNYADCPPPFVTFERHLGQKVYTINFRVEELSGEEAQDGRKFRYNTVTLPVGQYDRDTVISTLIRQKYRDDEMQAIVNNYLFDKDDEEALAEFNVMQEYRRFAKKVADQFLQEIQ